MSQYHSRACGGTYGELRRSGFPRSWRCLVSSEIFFAQAWRNGQESSSHYSIQARLSTKVTIFARAIVGAPLKQWAMVRISAIRAQEVRMYRVSKLNGSQSSGIHYIYAPRCLRACPTMPYPGFSSFMDTDKLTQQPANPRLLVVEYPSTVIS